MLALDDELKPWGKVVAMGRRDGERWYMFESELGVVSLVPGDLVELEKFQATDGEDDGRPSR